MKKPEKQSKEFYDYTDLAPYLEEKYSIKRDFWDWVFSYWYNVHNGSYHYLHIDEMLNDEYYNMPDEVKDALRIIREEFEPEMEIWVWW